MTDTTHDDLVKQSLLELQDLVRCRCHPAYTGRGMHDPECDCDSADAVKAVTDRIEELEAKLHWVLEERDATFALMLTRAETAEVKLAKLRTFLDELWDSQGYDARELHDLLKELDGVSDE